MEQDPYEELKDAQLVRNFPLFMEPEGSLSPSQEFATGPYPESYGSKPHHDTPVIQDTVSYYPLIYTKFTQVVLSLQVCVCISYLYPICTSFPVHLTFLDVITLGLLIFGEVYKL